MSWKKERGVINNVLTKIEAVREHAIAGRSRSAIAILLVTFLLKKSDKNIIQTAKCIIATAITCFIFTAMLHSSCFAQMKGYFRNPLDLPMNLSGNFAEIRSDHFHTGFDIRTNERTGFKVFAAADGYVSRIKVSGGGFGKALYITHPNGYMTVYGHLEQFNESIGKFVKEQQYVKESFEIELFPDAAKFPVKKGDVIAFSGNSGGSGGPHLHFEIRDASGETYPLNPASFYALPDTVAPKFYAAYIYPHDDSFKEPIKYSVKKSSSGYITVNDSITIYESSIGIAVDARDYMNNTTNDYGIYEMWLYADEKLIYQVKFDRLDFANGRYLNAYIDYGMKRRTGAIVQRLFRLPGDRNSIYHDVINDGKIVFTDTAFHQIKIIAGDANGNKATLNCYIKYAGHGGEKQSSSSSLHLFEFDQPHSFSTDSIQIYFPAGLFYEDLDFQYSSSSVSLNGKYSATHRVHQAYTPVHNYYNINIKPRYLPASLKSKAVIVYENEKGGRSSKTSHWEGDWLAARAREFGIFYVMIDTVKPKILPEGMKQNQLVTSRSLRFTISDNLSGIVSYRGLLDDKWVLMEYDPKNERLTCELDDDLPSGDHSIKVTVTDDVKNTASYTLKFKKQ